jgi:hypothetical protein
MRAALPIVAAAVLAAAGTASAEIIQLGVFENANGTDVSLLDINVEVVDLGGGAGQFIFHNDSGVNSVVTSLYIESTAFSLSGIQGLSIENPEPAGVDFSVGATPPNPPGSISGFGGPWGGNLFDADADSPGPKNGINEGESLGLDFTLSGITFADLVDALGNPADFRFAVHIQGVGPNEQSVWASTIPSPGAASLLALGGLLAARRRR